MNNSHSDINSEVSIDYGLFCGDVCQESLTLQAPRDSIEGKVGLIVSGFSIWSRDKENGRRSGGKVFS
ncbi:hypothetical protein GCM10020331_009410 [Ectobacillus funiculus]